MIAAGALALALAAQSAIDTSESPPPADPAVAQAQIGFIGSLFFVCLTAEERGVGVADLPTQVRSGWEPAPPGSVPERRAGRNGHGWVSRSGRVAIVERPGRCEVDLPGLPVADTVRRTAYAATQLRPPFTPIATRGRPNPNSTSLERVSGGVRLTLFVAGEEPGSPFHLTPRSVLLGVIERQPA